jgi:ribonucleoside-diphosphate reductase alpha chain
MDTIATLSSLALQYGVPLEALVSKFSHVRFEPSGFTKNPAIPMAKSLTDYIFRFLGSRFLNPEAKKEIGIVERDESSAPGEAALRPAAPRILPVRDEEPAPTTPPALGFRPQADAPTCPDCGSIMIRNGACYKCWNCGATSGCS